MARLLVGLKLKLLLRGLQQAGGAGTVGMVVTLVASLGAAVLGAAGLALLRGVEPATASTALAGAASALVLVWMLVSVSGGGEGTLEPERLVLFGLPARDLLPGLLLARGVGPGGAFTVVVLLGAVAAVSTSVLALLIGLLGAALIAALSLATACAAQAAVAGAASRRRWRDLALCSGPLLALAANLGARLLPGSSGRPAPGGGVDLPWLRVLPPAWPTEAMMFGRRGRYGEAVVLLLASTLLLLAVLWLWGKAMDRALASSAETRRQDGGRRRLVPAVFSRVDPRLAAVLSKDLWLVWRDPRQRLAFFSSVVPILPLMVGAGISGPARVLTTSAVSIGLIGPAMNLFGFDGGALWVNLSAGEELDVDLRAKVMARAIVVIGVAAVLATGVAAATGGWVYVGPAVAMSTLGVGVVLAVGIWVSLAKPVPMPDGPVSLWSAGNAGRSAATTLPTIGLILGLGLVLVGLGILAARLRDAPLALALACAAEVALGWSCWRIAHERAVHHWAGRGPELLEVVGAPVG